MLGSTGSVGRQTLEVAAYRNIRVEALAAFSDTARLEEQIRLFRPSLCAVEDGEAASRLKIAVADTPVKIIAGAGAAAFAAAETSAETVVNAISGLAGLRPALAALGAKKRLALANKETLVAAGPLVTEEAKKNGTEILPLDSEHSAIWQCLAGGQRPAKIILTASGGPFFGMKRRELDKITPADALRHPTWKMGKKITVDCATLMNKGLEVIEAARLFGVDGGRIEVVVHRESIIHSMVEYTDKAVIAQLGAPDMRTCIGYALSYPEREPAGSAALDLKKLAKLTFYEPDTETFTLLPLAYYALAEGGLLPAVMSAANEAAVSLFLDGKIGFTDIFDIVASVTRSAERGGQITLAAVEAADAAARQKVFEFAGALR